MIDARRMEVYFALYDANLRIVIPPSAAVLDENFMVNFLTAKSVIFFGNGMPKAKRILESSPNAYFLENIIPVAESQLHLAFQCFIDKQFIDLVTFEPDYIKSFMAKDPNTRINKVLNG
jgi:tRNA threonylcarbamoyladenosine biosynthesis protein TsaB